MYPTVEQLRIMTDLSSNITLLGEMNPDAKINDQDKWLITTVTKSVQNYAKYADGYLPVEFIEKLPFTGIDEHEDWKVKFTFPDETTIKTAREAIIIILNNII